MERSVKLEVWYDIGRDEILIRRKDLDWGGFLVFDGTRNTFSYPPKYKSRGMLVKIGVL